jgi:hypothetical protein
MAYRARCYFVICFEVFSYTINKILKVSDSPMFDFANVLELFFA